MTYTLMSSTDNMIDWFESEPEARTALQRIVELEPECADDFALFICDDDGAVIEGPIHALLPPESVAPASPTTVS